MSTTTGIDSEIAVITEVTQPVTNPSERFTLEDPEGSPAEGVRRSGKRGRHADPRARRRSNAALLAFVLSVLLFVVATTVLATRVVEWSLRPNATQEQAAGQTSSSAARDEKARTCEAAAEAARQALRHWSSYMDDVQALYLSTSTSQTADDLRQLSTSYRDVVADTVPVRDQLNACLVPDAG